MLNEAPLIFLLFLIPPSVILYYGLTAEEPKPRPDPPRQPPANCTPPDSVLAMMEPAASHPAEKPVARDSFYLPPVTRTPPAPLPDVHKTVASSPAETPAAPDPFSLLPVIPARPSPATVAQQPAAPPVSVPRDSPVAVPAAPAAVVRKPVAPILSGITESPGLYTVQPSRTIALGPPDGAGEPGAAILPGEPSGSRMTGALRYAAAAMTGSLTRAFLLVLATILLAVPLSGYLVRVMKGADPAPEVQGWAGLVIDGIKADLIVVMFTILMVVLVVLTGPSNLLWAGILLAAAILYVLPAAVLCFARTGSILAAFRPGSVTGAIAKIGWLPYTVFSILCFILFIGINFVYLIPYAGPALMVLLIAPLAIFEARYLALLAGRGGD